MVDTQYILLDNPVYIISYHLFRQMLCSHLKHKLGAVCLLSLLHYCVSNSHTAHGRLWMDGWNLAFEKVLLLFSDLREVRRGEYGMV